MIQASAGGIGSIRRLGPAWSWWFRIRCPFLNTQAVGRISIANSAICPGTSGSASCYKVTAFVAQRRADASAARTSAAEAGAAGWVLYWSSLVSA